MLLNDMKQSASVNRNLSIGRGVALLTAILPISLFAAPVYYTNEALFLSEASSLDVESFESQAVTGTFATSSITTSNFTISVAGNDLGILDSDFGGSYATDGQQYVRYQSDYAESITFTFNEAINSFGINLTDWGDWNAGTLEFSNSAGDSAQVASAPTANGAHHFFGLVNSALSFDTVTLTNFPSGEAFGFDELYFGLMLNHKNDAHVFEPAPFSMALFGLIALFVARRPFVSRRKRRA